jgi:hypothetical protein
MKAEWFVALLCLSFVTSAFADEPWQAYAAQNGVNYEQRAVAGSRFLEYRATVQIPLQTDEVLEQIWRGITENVPSTVKRREVLRHTETEFLVYDRIKVPVVSDRDVTISIRRQVDPSGVVEVRFETANPSGPPVDPKHVRIPVVRGAWTISPLGGNASQLRYRCYSEPGGSVPAWIARRGQQNQIMLDVEAILRPLRAAAERRNSDRLTVHP